MATNALAMLTLGGLSPKMGLREGLGIPRISCDRLSATRECSWSVSRLATVCHLKSHQILFAAELSDKEVIAKQARKQFCEEIAFCKQDRNVSLAKAMLLISAEDEAFISINKEKDNLAVQNEGRELPEGRMMNDGKCLETFPLAGHTISTWMAKFDSLSKEVALLATKENHHYPLQVLKAVNTILFEVEGFKTTVFTLDPRKCYLHHVMNLGSGSAVMLGIVYMEVCQRLGIKMVGAAVGEDFIIWPLLENIQDIFEASKGGESWFSEVNHTASKRMSCIFDNGIEGFVYRSSSGPNTTLKIASNRDIIEIALRNLKDLHWKKACRMRPGFPITGPLHQPLHAVGGLIEHSGMTVGTLLRPQDLRLATMATERLLILQPHNWALRRDHGLLLYHSRRYGEAVQELSICMALAPTQEAQTLEHFVEKLHLIRVELSWNPVKPPNTPSTLA